MSVTAARGFRAAGVAAGLKSSGASDVALVVNDGPHFAAAGVFTRNRVKAAPVLWSQQVLAAGVVRAVALNSGGANACTGPDGFLDTHRTAELVGALLEIGAGDVAVCSTGLIGVRLPTELLFAGLTSATSLLASDGGPAAAAAIMTTDSVAKVSRVDATGFVVGGMAKGAGMLAPSLATMLVVITTDAVADATVLDSVLRAATRVTFDRVDSDGCTSTNDTVLLLASGASGVEPSDDDLLDAFRGDGLDVGPFGELRIRHDRRRIRVHQNDPVTLLAQRLAGLGTGIVEFAGLADDDGPGPDDEDAVDIRTLRHCEYSLNLVIRHVDG